MRTPARVILVVLLAGLIISAFAESAKSLYNKGRKAEDIQDYAAAYEFYVEAYHQKPKELKYRIAYERSRFLAGAAHVKGGHQLRDQGKLDEAIAEFEKAAGIDPSSFIAVQELARTRKMKEAANAPPAAQPLTNAPPAPAPESVISKRLEEASGPVDLAPVSQQPITLELSNDSKVVYETIGKLAGVNVLFDPDYTPRRIVLKLNGVSLQEALDIIAFNSNTFWRPVTANTIYVAANTQTAVSQTQFTFDRQTPEATLVLPSDSFAGAQYFNSLPTISGTASDNLNTSRVEYRIRNQLGFFWLPSNGFSVSNTNPETAWLVAQGSMPALGPSR